MKRTGAPTITPAGKGIVNVHFEVDQTLDAHLAAVVLDCWRYRGRKPEPWTWDGRRGFTVTLRDRGPEALADRLGNADLVLLDATARLAREADH